VDVTTVHDIVGIVEETFTAKQAAGPLLWRRGYLTNARGSSNVLCRATPLSNSEKGVRNVTWRSSSEMMLRQKRRGKRRSALSKLNLMDINESLMNEVYCLA
jgi:hypothetical protein